MWSTEKNRRPSVGKGGQYGRKKWEGEIEILGRGEEGTPIPPIDKYL